MKTYLAKIASISLIIIAFSGCFKSGVCLPQKCVLPFTSEPIIDYSICDKKDNDCILEKALKNYEAQKDYATRLKVDSGVCR